jgi:5-methylcytosine-specific restriction endonuclease McrA
MSVLILNADAAPVSLLPLSTISWEEAIRYLVTDKATVLEWYEDWIVHSPTWQTRVPAVMMLKEFQKKKTSIRFSKQNVFLRDNYRCVYCEIELTRKTATLDHVLPTSKGGKGVWENCVTACGPCNSKKGNKQTVVPNMKPYKPNYFQLAEKRKRMKWDLHHPSWSNYI